jgi:hypothetical protein
LGETNEYAVEHESGLFSGHEELREHRSVRTSITVLDRFLGPFEGSKLAFLDSSDSYMFDLVYILCARAVLDSGCNVVYVDGGNEMDPYALSSLCKRFRVDRQEVLSRISIARAFTAYQLATIIGEELGDTLERTSADMLVVSCMPALFCDEDIGHSESRSMFRRCLGTLKELTEKRNLITIITNYDKRAKGSRRALLKRFLRDGADTTARFEKSGRRALRVWNGGISSYIDYHPVPFNQSVLEDFIGTSNGG